MNIFKINSGTVSKKPKLRDNFKINVYYKLKINQI